MASINPGTTTAFVKDAHYHPIRLTAKIAATDAAAAADLKNTAEKVARERRERHDATTYARGTLGKAF